MCDLVQKQAGVMDYSRPLRLYETGCALRDEDCCTRARQLHLYYMYRNMDPTQTKVFYEENCGKKRDMFTTQQCKVLEFALNQNQNKTEL